MEDGLTAIGDLGLMRVVLNNLLTNAWKFTARTAQAKIEVGALRRDDSTVYFVRDNGAGFESAGAARLF